MRPGKGQSVLRQDPDHIATANAKAFDLIASTGMQRVLQMAHSCKLMLLVEANVYLDR